MLVSSSGMLGIVQTPKSRRMNTTTGEPISTKQLSLSKAARIHSKFVSADSGPSHAISAYLHWASASFNELNQLHKVFELLQSNQKHRSHRSLKHDDRERIMENSIHRAEIIQVLNNGNAGQEEEKRTETADKFSEAPDNAVGHHAENEGGIKEHKKKKKKQKVETWEHGDYEVEIGGKKMGTNSQCRLKKRMKEIRFKVLKFFEEFIDGVGYNAGNESDSEKHRKRKPNESASWVRGI